jgi:hypothetical protein
MSSPEMITGKSESVDRIDFAVGCVVITIAVFVAIAALRYLCLR